MSNIRLFVMASLLVLSGFRLLAQEGLRPLQSNINYHYPDLGPQNKTTASPPQKQLNRSSSGSLFLPFKDDFSYAYKSNYPDGTLWTDSFAYVNTGFPKVPPSIGAATFDGLNQRGFPYTPNYSNFNNSYPADVLTSQPINLFVTATSQTLQPSDSIGISFYYQAAGNGDYPENNDSLILEFFRPKQQVWDTNHWYKTGPSPINYNDTNFKRVFVWITDSSYLHDGFKFRFRNSATTLGDFDHWNVDYIVLDKGRSALADTVFNDITFGAMPTPFLKNYSAMPFRQYTSNEMATRTSVKVRNNYSSKVSFDYKYEDFNDKASITPYQYIDHYNLWPYRDSGYCKTTTIANPKIDVEFKNLDNYFDFPIRHVLTATIGTKPTQDFTGNDTLVQYQRFRNYYAFDDGNAEAGYYVLASGGKMAVKVTLNTADTLTGANIYFSHVGNSGSSAAKQQFTLTLWSAGVNGPGTVLLSDTGRATYDPTGFKRIPFYPFSNPLSARILNPGTYYIGFKQGVANGITVGFDVNFNHRTSLYYDSGAGWTQSAFPGSLMIRPVFGNLNCEPLQTMPLGLTQPAAPLKKQVLVYPNPASNQLTVFTQVFQQCEVQVVNCLGQVLLRQPLESESTNLTTDQLPSGVYFLSVLENGKSVSQQKLIIGR